MHVNVLCSKYLSLNRTYPPGEQETSAIGGGVIGQPNLDAVARKFVAVSSTDNHVSFDTGIRYLF